MNEKKKGVGRPKSVKSWGSNLSWTLQVRFDTHPQLHSALYAYHAANGGDIFGIVNAAVTEYIKNHGLPYQTDEQCKQVAMDAISGKKIQEIMPINPVTVPSVDNNVQPKEPVVKNKPEQTFVLVEQDSTDQSVAETTTPVTPANHGDVDKLSELVNQLGREQVIALLSQNGIPVEQADQNPDGVISEEAESLAEQHSGI